MRGTAFVFIFQLILIAYSRRDTSFNCFFMLLKSLESKALSPELLNCRMLDGASQFEILNCISILIALVILPLLIE